jgi:hypothetical protein
MKTLSSPDILFNVLTKYRVGFQVHLPLNKKTPQRIRCLFARNGKQITLRLAQQLILEVGRDP